jgi:hypothetical protein
MLRLTSDFLKRTAMVLLAVPMLILAAFAIGELAGGDVSGLQHVPELSLLALLGWLAWKRPFWGGTALIALALVFMGLYPVFMRGLPLPAVVLTVAILFALPVIAGRLFVAAARQDGPETPGSRGAANPQRD